MSVLQRRCKSYRDLALDVQACGLEFKSVTVAYVAMLQTMYETRGWKQLLAIAAVSIGSGVVLGTAVMILLGCLPVIAVPTALIATAGVAFFSYKTHRSSQAKEDLGKRLEHAAEISHLYLDELLPKLNLLTEDLKVASDAMDSSSGAIAQQAKDAEAAGVLAENADLRYEDLKGEVASIKAALQPVFTGTDDLSADLAKRLSVRTIV